MAKVFKSTFSVVTMFSFFTLKYIDTPDQLTCEEKAHNSFEGLKLSVCWKNSRRAEVECNSDKKSPIRAQNFNEKAKSGGKRQARLQAFA